jgi:hypothetical protein
LTPLIAKLSIQKKKVVLGDAKDILEKSQEMKKKELALP